MAGLVALLGYQRVQQAGDLFDARSGTVQLPAYLGESGAHLGLRIGQVGAHCVGTGGRGLPEVAYVAAGFGHVPVVRGGQVPGNSGIFTSGPSLPGGFTHASFQPGHAGFKVRRLSHAGSVQRYPATVGSRQPAWPGRLRHEDDFLESPSQLYSPAVSVAAAAAVTAAMVAGLGVTHSATDHNRRLGADGESTSTWPWT